MLLYQAKRLPIQFFGSLLASAGIEMDFTDLKFTDESFDVVIDKGGMDALLVS
jgi:hypothetical protein